MSATVLIIDDDRELCALLAEFMLLEGFAASAIHDGAAAVTHCRDHVYDVIVRAEARTVDELGKLVVAKIQSVEGITRTLTCPVVHL